MARGKFITFEGGEGGGKSTQVKRLIAALEGSGIRAIATREPGAPLLQKTYVSCWYLGPLIAGRRWQRFC